MGKGFTEQERTRIRAALLEQGRSLLSTYGLRRTSVEDLTSAAGISKGAFYRFFPSKEELFYTIFEEFESAYRNELMLLVISGAGAPAEQLRRFLEQAFSLWRESPLFRHFGQAELEQLVRRLPPERLAEGVESDERFAARLIAAWADQGITITISPEQLNGLLRALFFVGLHAEEIGATYPETSALLIELVAGRISSYMGRTDCAFTQSA